MGFKKFGTGEVTGTEEQSSGLSKEAAKQTWDAQDEKDLRQESLDADADE